MRKMKDSGVEWIGEIPENWEVIKSKYIIALNDSGVWGADPNGGIHDKIVIRSTEQTIDGKWTIIEPAKRNLENVKYENSRILKDDLLMTKSSGSDLHIGKTTIADDYFNDNECYFSNFIQRIRVKNINPKLIWYMFNSNIVREQFVYLQNATSGIGNINGANINNIYIPIGKEYEQKKIVNYLDEKCAKIDAIVEKQQTVIEKLKEYKLSVITEAVTKGLNPNVEMKYSSDEWIGFGPNSWNKIKLKTVCQFINGDRSANYPSPNEFVDEGIPFCGADSLNERFVDTNCSKKITIEKYNSMGGAKIEPGDILYTLRGSTIGKNSMAKFKDGTVASSLMVIRPLKIYPEFLLYWLNSEIEFQQRMSFINGSTAPNLSAENVGTFILNLPSQDEQVLIANYLDIKCNSVEKIIKKKECAVKKLIEYKKSLIYEVVTGKKEV